MPVAWNKYFPFWWTNNICGCKCSSVAVKREGFHIISCHPHQYILHIKRAYLNLSQISNIRNLYSTWSWVWEKEALFKFKFLKIPSNYQGLYYLGRESSISVFLSLFELFAPLVNFPTVNFFGLHMFTKEVRLRISPSAGNKMLGKLVGWRPRMKAKLSTKKKIHLNLP